jgi:hypothetical protein
MFLPAMFLIVVGCVIGGVLYSRYRCAGSTQSFLKLEFVRGVFFSLLIGLSALVAVNFYGLEKKKSVFTIAADSLTAEERDTTAASLLSKSPQFQYTLLQKLNTFDRYGPYRKAVKRQYISFLSHERTVEKGAFGMGLLHTLNDSYDSALLHFAKIKGHGYPFVHFLKADIAFERGQPGIAEQELRQELAIPGGNFKEAYLKLMDLYDGNHDFDRLAELLRLSTSEALFPDHLARKTLLHSGDFGGYTKKLLLSVHAQINGYGLAASSSCTDQRLRSRGIIFHFQYLDRLPGKTRYFPRVSDEWIAVDGVRGQPFSFCNHIH